MRLGGPAPQALLVWELAERFHWTLDYIRGLTLADLHEFLQIEDGRDHARKSILNNQQQ